MKHSRILIVEDNDDSRVLLHYLLLRKGYEVRTAVNGAEGVCLAKAEKPDLIITDLTMPGTDGIELIKQLRADPEIARKPILVYTAFGTGESGQQALDAGATQLFDKPLDFETMLQFVEDFHVQSDDSSIPASDRAT